MHFKCLDCSTGGFGVVLIAIFIFCVPLLDSSWDLPFIVMVEYFLKSQGIIFLMTLPFMGGLLVYVHLKAAHLVILMTSFAKVSDPYLIFYDFLKISGMCHVRSYFPCHRKE